MRSIGHIQRCMGVLQRTDYKVRCWSTFIFLVFQALVKSTEIRLLEEREGLCTFGKLLRGFAFLVRLDYIRRVIIYSMSLVQKRGDSAMNY